MKRIGAALLLVLILTGCVGKNETLARGMGLRAKLLAGNGCRFTAQITADYGDKTYTFTMDCQADPAGAVSFSVTEPEPIRGITGKISQEGGKLTFDTTALTFSLLADGQVSPVSAPWLLVKTLLGGYVTSCGMDGEQLRLSVDDSYEEDALHLDIWLDGKDLPQRAEILWDDRRILSLEVKNFEIL